MIQNKHKVYIEASVVGVLRGLIGLPFEHPFDSIKSRLQTEISHNVGFGQMARQIYREQGVLKGFYGGFIPSAARFIVKQLYRWPLMLILPEFYNTVYPSHVKKKYPSILKITTGLTLAVVDTFIVCPFERLKVCLQTKTNDLTVRKFMRQNREHLTSSLFRGLNSLFYRQVLSWITFLYSDYKLKQVVRKYQGLSTYDDLDNMSLFVISILVGIINVFIVMPFDMTKTLYQQHSEEFTNKKLSDTIKLVYRNNGFRGFYNGWQPRLVQYSINSIFTVTALEKLEQKIKKSNPATHTI